MPQEKANILFVDDEPGWRDLFAWQLSLKGYSVTCADTGVEAIEKSKHGAFDLMITDFNMPGMTGIEAFLAIKQTQPLLKVILITGMVLESHAQKFKEAICIQKPFDFNSMIQTIQQTLMSSHV